MLLVQDLEVLLLTISNIIVPVVSRVVLRRSVINSSEALLRFPLRCTLTIEMVVDPHSNHTECHLLTCNNRISQVVMALVLLDHLILIHIFTTAVTKVLPVREDRIPRHPTVAVILPLLIMVVLRMGLDLVVLLPLVVNMEEGTERSDREEFDRYVIIYAV